MLTKYTAETLNGEIDAELEACRLNEQVAHPAWITHRICRNHIQGLAVDADQSEDVEPVDVAYWRYNGYTNTRHSVNGRIKERGHLDDCAVEQQPCFPGYEYLQRSYVTRRDGEDVEVPTTQMTVTELLAKADQYDANAQTMSLHAAELRRYAAERAEATA